ncbi:MAG TPA: LamG domain-containing protein, partial [Candidatus Thermoplasmatota archaeon]|nr:LamG domain-containing protein [Candidatus Thermoplasmatota archaeon]
TTAPEPLNAIAALSNRTLLGVGDGNRVWRFGGANLVLGAANAAGEGSFEGLLDGVRVSRTARDAVKDGLPTMGRASASFPPTHLGENVTSAATVALYRFHTAQNVTRDETGRHPLTLVGGASHEAADTSPATGSKGALRIPEGGAAYTLDDTRFDLGTTGTLEAYVRPRNPFAGGVIINREIPSAEASGVSYRLHVNGEGMPELLLGDGLDLTRVTSSVPLKANEWAHVAATWDGFWARLYVNGKLTGATPQAAYAYDNPYLDARNLTLSRRPVVIPWLGVEAPGAFPLTAVSLGRDGAFLAVGGGQVVRGASFVDQERGDWVRDAGLKGLGNPALWVGRGVTSTDGAVLYADSRDAARYVANLQDGSLTTLSTTDKTNAQNLYTNVVLRIRHAPTGPVSLYLTRLPAVELPSRVHNATPTAEDAAVDLVAVPGGTAPVERFLIASWNGTGQGTEWRTDTILLDHILAKANLSASWFLLNGLLLEVGPGATWAVDELEVKGDFTSSLGKPRRDTLLFTAGATSGNVGRWSPAVGGGQSVSQAGAGIGPYWVSTTSTGRMTTGSLWRVSENLYKGDGAWVYNDRVTGEYGNVEDARLVTPPVSLNEVIHPTLTFLTKYRFRLDESRRYDADPSPAVTTNIPITDLLGLGMVEIQVQNDDGSWGPFLPIVPQGGYPRAPTGTYIDPGARLQPTMGFWGSSNSSWPDLLKRPEVENPRSKFNESILGESTWVPVSFNLTNQDLPVNPMGRTVRFSFHTLAIPGSSGADPHVRSEGWYITDVRVKGSERAAIDLALVNATLSTPYNAALLGVGPGTTVPVKVNVTNRGLFPVSGYNVTLEAREVLNRATGLLGPVVSRDESPRLQEALLPGGTATVEIPWRVPAKARADYVVTLRVLPGTEIDGDLTNDAVALGTARVPISAKVSPDAAVNILVTPKAATRGIERRIDVTVSNTGNVPLTNFTLERTIERVTASGRADLLSTEDLGWKLETRSEKGLLPGATEDARRFRIVARDHNATDFAEDFRDRELRWTPPENARFVFTATVRLESGDRNATNNVAKDFIDSFSVFHEDALDTLLTAEEGGYSLDAGWRLSEAAAKGEGKGFVFGDPSTGRVPADADASLLLPVVDVSSAASAILTFSTNVSFESRYDGGIVETRSYRNGAWGPWHRISPEPFPGARHVVDTLHDGNPIARASTDPAAVRGLTNDSRGSFAEETGETDGWFTVSYNLGKAPGMTERATFVSHPLDTLLNDALPLIADPQKIQRPDESNLSRAVFRGKSWGEGVESWEYHDLTYNEPWPKVGPSFLWSGSGDLTDDGLRPAATAPGAGTGGAVHRLAYTVDLRTLPADHDAALRFWLWHPQGVEIACTIEKTLPFCLRVYNATAYAADANNYASFDPTKATILAQDGAWTLYEMPFSLLATNAGPLAFAGKEMTLRFEFGAQRPYRGVVVDGITVTTFRVSGLDRVDVKEIASESVGLPTPSLTFARRDQPQAAGTELTMAKGLTWAEVRPEPGAGEGLLYTPAVPNNPTPWIIATAPGGVPGEEDRYFTTSNPAVNNGKYAVNADTRLVTPLIDLTRVLGDNVTLRFSEKHAFAPALSMGDVLFPAHYGVVEASVLNEASGEWGPWHTRCAKGPQKATESCRFLGGDFNDASWASHEYNVSDLKGQKVRFAFRVVGGPLGPLQGFAIDDLQVEGDVLTGAPLQIRLRAGTDGSGHRGAWRVDDLQVVGTTYKNNLEVSLATPPTVKVTPGGTFYVNGTVRNLGENTRDSLVLRLTAAPPSAAGEEAPLPTLQLAEMRPGAPVRPGATGTLTVGPFNLLRNANASFSVLVTAPARPFADDQDKTEYVVSVGARRFTDSATYPRLVEDEVTTNLDRTVLATSRAYREVVFKSVTASPSNATPGEPITLRALLE